MLAAMLLPCVALSTMTQLKKLIRLTMRFDSADDLNHGRSG